MSETHTWPKILSRLKSPLSTLSYIGSRVYPIESIVIAVVSPWSVVRPSVRPSLNISETVHWFFLIFCMKLEDHKGTKVTEPDF